MVTVPEFISEMAARKSTQIRGIGWLIAEMNTWERWAARGCRWKLVVAENNGFNRQLAVENNKFNRQLAVTKLIGSQYKADDCRGKDIYHVDQSTMTTDNDHRSLPRLDNDNGFDTSSTSSMASIMFDKYDGFDGFDGFDQRLRPTASTTFSPPPDLFPA